eukprot:Polyplicarium_translucidae@DN1063_c0_g1_i2.p1
MLNGVLPHDVRILGACQVRADFDARFDCALRTYKYYFPSSSLDLQEMQDSAQLFVGTHDFGGFAKRSAKNVQTPTRSLLTFKVERDDDYIGVATIAGLSFLWHQVRYMMAILLRIGKGESVAADITERLRRGDESPPRYPMAPAEGLVLHDCLFKNDVKVPLCSDSKARTASLFQARHGDLRRDSSVMWC